MSSANPLPLTLLPLTLLLLTCLLPCFPPPLPHLSSLLYFLIPPSLPEGSTGVIRTARELDFDSGDTSYNIDVIATDGGLVPQSATTSVQITITDVNDCTPTFAEASYTVSIMENAEMGMYVHMCWDMRMLGAYSMSGVWCGVM